MVKNRRGFTFIQVVIAICILGIALTPILMINLQSNKNLEHNRLHLECLNVLDNVLSIARKNKTIFQYSKGFIVDSDNYKKFYIETDIFKKNNARVEVLYKHKTNNFVQVICTITYTNTIGKQVEMNVESGVFLNVY